MVIDWEKTEKTPNLTAPAAEVTPGPPPEAATQHDLPLGRRVAAAFVDLGLLSGLYIILALIVGPTSPGIGPVNVTLVNITVTSPSGSVFRFGLFGAWAVLYLILVACYYFGLEALAGQTVGKALLGLRVLQPDGARPAARQIAMRTLLRLFDVLPALYLVGFIAVLSSGRQRRQRLGDMAAGTVVDRTARSSRPLVLAWTCVVAVVLATAGLSAVRLASPGAARHTAGTASPSATRPDGNKITARASTRAATSCGKWTSSPNTALTVSAFTAIGSPERSVRETSGK